MNVGLAVNKPPLGYRVRQIRGRLGRVSAMSTASKASQLEQEWPPPLYTFGVPWPEFNDGLSYTDVIRSSQNGVLRHCKGKPVSVKPWGSV
ncbi:hypothetical protein M5K25_018992 [Dendrobium thyrsiflorum]|uniref:Uncharacterized protein n=1 Tax=Dendrobium thyrsiflorum TaxID=117978 RepID=A0ABD0UKK0_DENTH